MNGKTGEEKGNGGREPVSVTVTLPSALVDQLKEFCRNCRVTRDIVVERALIEYFREGDMSH
jgi:predicted transcriptional regulator